MTRIEDMSEPERQSWITVLADGAVFIYFWQAMTQSSKLGFGFRGQNFSPSELASIIAGVVILTVVFHAGIALVFELRKRKAAYQRDERDREISRKGDRNGYAALQAGVGGVLVLLLSQYIVGADFKPPISVMTPSEMVFALCSVSYVSSLIKHITMIIAYRP